ncbi:MAG: hypothetical protein KAS12_05845 [Candidatus Aenigmarchaeota archaeon]|nr:hypothetical protein [Candidatus Aenigmarchaeota archaeon]
MSYEILMSGLNSGEKSTKDNIVNILSVEWPLSARIIHNKLRKNYDMHISYQSVHKTLNMLEEKMILEKNNKEYQLNLEWIRSVQKITTQLENAYLKKLPAVDQNLFNDDNANTVKFNTIANLDRFILLFFEKNLLDKDKKDIICCSYWTHAWWPVVLNETNYSLLKKIINPKRYYISFGGKSIAETGCTKFFKKLGFNAKMGLSLGVNYEFVIFNDMIIQIYFPPKLNQNLKKIHTAKNITDMDLNKLSNLIFNQNYDITVIILKNKTIANQLKSKIMSKFKD